MIISNEQQAEFTKLAKPLIKWLCENTHPHATIIVNPTGAELVEGIAHTGEVTEFIVD